jgi:hypothetical protein
MCFEAEAKKLCAERGLVRLRPGGPSQETKEEYDPLRVTSHCVLWKESRKAQYVSLAHKVCSYGMDWKGWEEGSLLTTLKVNKRDDEVRRRRYREKKLPRIEDTSEGSFDDGIVGRRGVGGRLTPRGLRLSMLMKREEI